MGSLAALVLFLLVSLALLSLGEARRGQTGRLRHRSLNTTAVGVGKAMTNSSTSMKVCGPQTFVKIPASDPTAQLASDGVCTEVSGQTQSIAVCGPGTFRVTPFSCTNYGKYASGDIIQVNQAGDGCTDHSLSGSPWSEGWSYVVNC